MFTYFCPISCDAIARIYSDITKELKEDDMKKLISVERSFDFMLAITKAVAKDEKKSVSEALLRDVVRKNKVVGITMAMITQHINSCNKHMEPVINYSSDESKVSESVSNAGRDNKSNVSNDTKMSNTSVNVSNPDDVSMKDLLNAENSVVGDSQTVIPGDDEEKSNDILLSEDVNAFENDINEPEVSIAVNALLDFNTYPTGKLHVTGPPPIPEHAVIHQQKDVSGKNVSPVVVVPFQIHPCPILMEVTTRRISVPTELMKRVIRIMLHPQIPFQIQTRETMRTMKKVTTATSFKKTFKKHQISLRKR